MGPKNSLTTNTVAWGTLRYSALRAAELALAAARQGLRQSSPTPPGATALLGVQHKACGLLNVSGFYNPLLVFLDHAVEQRFVRAEHRDMIVIDDDPVRLIRRLKAWTMPEVSKWMDRKPD